MVLCGLLNSYVANYLIRLRVNTHVTVSLMSRLPVPLLTPSDRPFARIVSLVRQMVDGKDTAEETDAYAELQAVVAALYGLRATDLEHVLSTFPLVPKDLRERVSKRFTGVYAGPFHPSNH
jgi:hypothetical protein